MSAATQQTGSWILDYLAPVCCKSKQPNPICKDFTIKTGSDKGYEKVPGTRDKQCHNSLTIMGKGQGDDQGLSLDKCAAMVNAEARCGDYFAYWKGGECHCVRAGQKCEPYQDNEEHDVYRLTPANPKPGACTRGKAETTCTVYTDNKSNQVFVDGISVYANPGDTPEDAAPIEIKFDDCAGSFNHWKSGKPKQMGADSFLHAFIPAAHPHVRPMGGCIVRVSGGHTKSNRPPLIGC